MEQNKFLKPMGFAEILDASIRVYRKNFLALVIAHSPLILLTLISTLTQTYYTGVQSPFESLVQPTYEPTSLLTPSSLLMYLLVAFLILILQILIVYPVAFGAATKVVSDSILRTPSVKEAYRFSLKNILKLGLTNLIIVIALVIILVIVLFIPLAVSVAVLTYAIASTPTASFSAAFGGIFIVLIVALIFCLIPAFIWTRLIAVYPVMVNEERYFLDALGRSWELVKGRTIVTFLVMVIIYFIPSIIQVSSLFAELLVQDPVVSSVLIVGGGFVVQAFLIPLVCCARVVTYFELRARKEAFDLEKKVEKLTEQ
jgi:hypothetical protein